MLGSPVFIKILCDFEMVIASSCIVILDLDSNSIISVIISDHDSHNLAL